MVKKHVSPGLINSGFNVFLVTVLCPSLSLSNGDVGYSQYGLNERWYVGTEANFWCNSGYDRSGDSKRTCQSSGNWDGRTPTCKKREI